MYADISRAQPTDSPVKKAKITSHHEERTLQRRRAKYTTILPYIHCYFVKKSYELEGDRELDQSVLTSIVPQYLAELTSTKRTKPIRLPHVRQLVFLPSRCFSEFVHRNVTYKGRVKHRRLREKSKAIGRSYREMEVFEPDRIYDDSDRELDLIAKKDAPCTMAPSASWARLD